MKKTIGLFLSILLVTVMLPLGVKAEDSYTSQTLDEAATAEGITYSHGDFSNSSDKVTIYLFRGAGCSHCYAFLTFLESIVPDYGKYFNVVTYEVWNNTNNASLMQQVASVFGDDASGVPYIIIGDKTYIGYASSMDSEIEQLITDQYNSSDKYDVMDHLGEVKSDDTKEDTTTKTSSNTAVIVTTVIIVGVAIAGLYYLKSTNDKEEIIATIKSDKKVTSTNKTKKVTKKTSKK